MTVLHDQIPEAALAWARAGKGAALATVIETWGSAPRQAGSQLAISGEGEMLGSVSGGCVPVGDGPEALPETLLTQLTEARAAPRAAAIVTTPATWERRLVLPGEDPAADARFRSDRSGMEEDGRFIAIHNPPLRLIVVGAVHIAQPLLAIARTCGYAPTLIDPRAAFGSQERFPGETILDDWPDEALAALKPDARTAIVTLTHDPKLDDPAIRAALNSPAFYLGCLGSTRTHAKRVERLTAAGFTPDQIAKIHAPVGLNIGAKSPAEIAVSIMAQITETLRT